jgi:hypothetical protein
MTSPTDKPSAAKTDRRAPLIGAAIVERIYDNLRKCSYLDAENRDPVLLSIRNDVDALAALARSASERITASPLDKVLVDARYELTRWKMGAPPDQARLERLIERITEHSPYRGEAAPSHGGTLQVPHGMKLVPVKPTPETVSAFREKWDKALSQEDAEFIADLIALEEKLSTAERERDEARRERTFFQNLAKSNLLDAENAERQLAAARSAIGTSKEKP